MVEARTVDAEKSDEMTHAGSTAVLIDGGGRQLLDGRTLGREMI